MMKIPECIKKVLAILLFPLIFVEVLALLLCGVKWLPPLSWILSRSPLKGTFRRDAIPAHPEVPEKLADKLEDVTSYGLCFKRAKGDAAEAIKTTCEVMLAYNTVDSTRSCPTDLQGIFWMDGNKFPEELACLSYASWDEENMVLTKVNGTLGWSYTDTNWGRFGSWWQEKDQPSGMQFCKFENSDLKEGRFYSPRGFDYEDLNWLTSICDFSMERLDGPGVNYKRGCYWFPTVFGRQRESGSYTLRKIMHTDKTPVQPAYDDFVKYMAKKGSIRQMMSTLPTVTESV